MPNPVSACVIVKNEAPNYGTYGTVIYESNAANGDRFKFDGGEYDGNLGLYHFGARWQDPTDGRWISQDPLGLGPDSNPYRFVGNSPTNFTDPSGELIFLIPAGYFIAAGVIGAIFIFPPEVNPPPNRPPNPGDPIGGALVGMALVGAVEAAAPATASVWAWLRSVGVFGAGAGTSLGVNALTGNDKAIIQAAMQSTTSAAGFQAHLAALANAVLTFLGPAGQVTRLGTLGGNVVYGSVTSGVGIVSINGITMVVQKVGPTSFQILGPFLP